MKYKHIDIGKLLSKRRQVAIIWCVDDVKHERPDLTDDQAFQVLMECERRHDCTCGFTWSLIADVAGEIFPEGNDTPNEATK